MDFKSLLITGGAGFVGSKLALLFRNARPEIASDGHWTVSSAAAAS